MKESVTAEQKIDLKEYLTVIKNGGAFERIIAALEKIKEYKVLLIGDAIIDEYVYVDPLSKTMKDSVIAALYERKEIFAGGVMAAANHLASFCKEVVVVTSLGREGSYREVIRKWTKPNVLFHILYREGVSTTRKVRFIDHGYSMRKLFEVYYMDDNPLQPDIQGDLDDFIDGNLNDFDLVVVTDFGHGLIDHKTVEKICNLKQFVAVNAQTNSANYGFNLITKYQGVDYICLDGIEARLAMNDGVKPLYDLVGKALSEKTHCPRIAVTKGKEGCYIYGPETDPLTFHHPALTDTIVDPIGAGDAFFVVTAPLVAAGLFMGDIGFVGNIVGAIETGIIGHSEFIEREAVIKRMKSLLKIESI